jgi:hypothetical protein
MKKILFIFILALCLTNLVFSANSGDMDKDKAAVKKTIVEAYVKGIHINRDVDAIKKGFDSEFNMVYLHGDHVHKLPISEWITKIKASKEKNPEPSKAKITYKFPMVDVTGNAAVAKIEIFKDGKHIYSDYMALYKINEEWKIVNKIYYSHK